MRQKRRGAGKRSRDARNKRTPRTMAKGRAAVSRGAMVCRICERRTAFVRCLKCGHWVCLFWGCSKIGKARAGHFYRVTCFPRCLLRKVMPREPRGGPRLSREELHEIAWLWNLGPLAELRRRPVKRWS